jgi:hypothetical protein
MPLDFLSIPVWAGVYEGLTQKSRCPPRASKCFVSRGLSNPQVDLSPASSHTLREMNDSSESLEIRVDLNFLRARDMMVTPTLHPLSS